MKLSFFPDDPNYRPIAAMVEDQARTLPSLLIAEQDGLYALSEQSCGTRILGLMAYFRAGIQISDTLRQITSWHFGSQEKVGSFLEFGCEYGRTTRFLLQDFGKERFWASDVLPRPLEFQRQELGTAVIESTAKPESFKPGVQWDCIFAGSLFSHLREATFTRWLWKLHSLLAPGGLLIFSVHGEFTLPVGAGMPRSGLLFVPTPELLPSNGGDNGFAFVTDGFVRNAILAVTGGLDHRRIPQGLCFRQDLYLVSKGKSSEQTLNFQFGPNGCVDVCRWTEPEQMKVTGWAMEITPGESIERVEVFYNDVLRGSCGINHLRPDVATFLRLPVQASALQSGWDCVVQLEGEKIRPEQDWMLVKAVSTSGLEFVLRLDHPANISEFESPSGWTYDEREGRSRAILGVLRHVDYPPNGKFVSSDTALSGWIATKEPGALEGLVLEGRFGAVPFTAVERPDVSAILGFASVGFDAVLPPEYLKAADPRLRFITSSGVVLATLEIFVDLIAIETDRLHTASVAAVS